MAFAEFSKILEKAESDLGVSIKKPTTKEAVAPKKEEVLAPRRSPKPKPTTRKDKEPELEDVVTQQESQIEIIPAEIETIEETTSLDTLALFNYKDYTTPIFTGIDAVYSCIRFDQLKSEGDNSQYLKFHEFPVFNYRVYYSREYRFIANTLLSKLKTETSELINVMNIPVLIDVENSLITMCKDYDDDLDIEHIIKVMLLNKANFQYFQIVVLDNYATNTVKEIEEFDTAVVEEYIKYLGGIINSTKTYEYTESTMCEKCIFKPTCEKHPEPLAFTILKN